MNSILFRIRFIVLISVVSFAGILIFCFDSFLDWRNTYSELKNSWEIEATLKSIRYTKTAANELVEWRKQLSPQYRQDAMSSIIQSINNRKYSTIPTKINYFVKQETQYRDYLTAKLDAHRSRIIWCIYMLITCFVASTIFISIYIHRSIFEPLENLYNRMLDFLNDRYTYEFQAPDANEIGDLQSTFNSLAQRVINNIEELKTLDSAKSEFLNIASHELRTPLTSIKGSLSLLKGSAINSLNPQSVSLLNIAESETDRLIRLINDLLDLAKIEAKKLNMDEKWLQTEELLHKTFGSLQGLCETAQVKLAIRQQLPIDIFADQDRIQQVLTNFLSNAIKYSPEKGYVTVNYFVNARHQLVVEISDQGKGIAPEDQKYIFEKFRQATNKQNPLVKGTGLGLAIAKAIVEQHGGEIGVSSLPQKGSTFYFTLPKWKYRKQGSGAAA